MAMAPLQVRARAREEEDAVGEVGMISTISTTFALR